MKPIITVAISAVLAITGGIAQAYYKEIPESIITEMRNRLPSQFWTVMEQLESKVNPLT